MGVGNVLMADDGVGARSVTMLQARVPHGVRVVERSLLGLDALADVEQASHLLLLDSIDAGRPPGEILRLAWPELPESLGPRLSPHELALGDLLALAAIRGNAPDEVVVMGIQPARIGPGLDLSPEVAAALPGLVTSALGVLKGWVSAKTEVAP